MAIEVPPFWWKPGDWRGHVLAPVGALYGAVASWRFDRGLRRAVDAPVLCVGNFTDGGAGKTPVCIALARHARQMGLTPGILSRGHGGNLGRPHRVDPEHDLARNVGDEPLLLARDVPVAVTPNRHAGATLLMEEGVDFLIMDDGFQSQRLAIDHALMVVDAGHGIGNGYVMPAGPLRAPLLAQFRHVDSLLVMGKGHAAEPVIRMAARAGRRIHRATTVPIDAEALRDRRVYAYCGIGVPQKFYDTLEALGARIIGKRSFGDHHMFDEDEADELRRAAMLDDAELVTTEKDAVRLRGSGPALQALLDASRVLAVEARFDDPAAAQKLIEITVAAYWKRRLSGRTDSSEAG